MKDQQFQSTRDRQLASIDEPHTASVSTDDHDTIRRWAARHRAEPATGEATSSGPAVLTVNDGGAGVRFNFPGFAPFRPISWREWLANFDRHQLIFVYEKEVAERAYELWEARGGSHGDDRSDWLRAEREIQPAGAGPSPRYRIVTRRPGSEI